MLYFTDQVNEILYTLDPATCPVCDPVAVGVVMTEDGGEVDVDGADIDFSADYSFIGTLTNSGELEPPQAMGPFQIWGIDQETAIATHLAPLANAVDTSNGFAYIANTDSWVAASNDSHLLGIKFGEAQQVFHDYGAAEDCQTRESLELMHGDMAGSRDCSLIVESRQTEVRPGETLHFDIRLVHQSHQPTEKAFSIWIENERGNVVATRDSRSYPIHWLDRLLIPRQIQVPRDAEPGRYVLWVEISGMRQGVTKRSYDFFVTRKSAALGANAPN